MDEVKIIVLKNKGRLFFVILNTIFIFLFANLI